MKKTILFRADSSFNIGTGHIMRDLVLAKQYSLKGHTIIFAVQDLKGNINHKIIEENYTIQILKSNDIEELIEIIKHNSVDMIVIDHYKINYSYEKKIKKRTNIKILSLDDTYEKHYCDILLNHNISAKPKKYKNKVPKNCTIKCGSKFTLLRDEFYKEQKRYRRKQDSKTIFIAMGGADTANLNIPILKILKKFINIKVNIVTTNSNRKLQKLINYSKNKKWINLQVNSTKIAKLIGKSDLAIITPSVISNEVYFMKKPLIAIKTADNQKEIYKFLKKKKFSCINKFSQSKLEKILKEIKL